jgi:hypothetical protein
MSEVVELKYFIEYEVDGLELDWFFEARTLLFIDCKRDGMEISLKECEDFIKVILASFEL